MNVFYEFHKIVKIFQEENIDYALIGGVAVAFYAEPRFTKDIDILIRSDSIDKIRDLLKDVGYLQSSPPTKLENGKLILHRFIKVVDFDEMILDILVIDYKGFEDIVENAKEVISKETGVVMVADKADLIRLKKLRNSPQDKADIAMLKNENS